MDTSEKKHIVTLPPTCVDPSKYKVGDNIEYKIKGKVKSSDEDFGVQVELSDNEQEPDMDEFENDDPEEQERKIKKQMDNSKALEEY